MANVIELMEDGPVKNWYKNNVNPSFLNQLVEKNESHGYKLDTKSGLLFKSPYSNEVIKRLGYTVVDIIFPRPVDLHHHEDVDEALRVVEGMGVLYTRSENGGKEESLCAGREVYVPKNVSHSFRPDRNSSLTVRLACSGILDSNKEICEKRFDEFELWEHYYKRFRISEEERKRQKIELAVNVAGVAAFPLAYAISTCNQEIRTLALELMIVTLYSIIGVGMIKNKRKEITQFFSRLF